jgi:methyltransferase family protein
MTMADGRDRVGRHAPLNAALARLRAHPIASVVRGGVKGLLSVYRAGAHPTPACTDWSEIPGWFRWRSAQREAVAHFPDGSHFVEVGVYLGRSLCSLGEVVAQSGKRFSIVGVDNCRGSGVEGPLGKDYHGAAVAHGGGTFAGTLHRNIIQCGYSDSIALIVADSITASTFFSDRSLAWVHLDARHDKDSLQADIAAWRTKVKVGGWLSGDDYDDVKWPGVVSAVRESLPAAQPWSDKQWRHIAE